MANRTYRYFTGKPLYPFGYGLSYSKFEYNNIKLSANTLQAGDTLSIEKGDRVVGAGFYTLSVGGRNQELQLHC